MPNDKATPADAELILKLYDLRRESTMREARNWFANFWPESADEIMEVMLAFGSQENAYFRQVLTYWEHAAALVRHGGLNREVFFDTQGEMWFVYAKLQPFLEEIRQRTGVRDSMKNIESVIYRTPVAQERLATMQERAKRFRQMRSAQASKEQTRQ
jgi:hypothetical protein